MKIITVVLLCILAAGCLSPQARRPWMPYRGDDGVVQYSEYFDAKPIIADGQIKAHIIITLGRERVPAGTRIDDPDVPTGKLTAQDYRDGLYEAVSEIYFTNLSSKPITIQEITLQTVEFKSSALTPRTITIEPNAFARTDPIIKVGSLYKREYPFVLSYTLNGNQSTIKGVIPRVKVQDIGKH